MESYLICAGMLGLLVGSFLNVVIYRLPIMLIREWQSEYQLYSAANEPITLPADAAAFNLLTPRSHCPHCQKPVPIWANLPLIGYLVLRGKCLFCKYSISLRYPLIEFITALISIVIVQHFGLHWQSISALVLSWGLIALAAIDIDQQLLPDVITLPLLWLGLLVNLFQLHANTHDAIIGAIAGYLCLWTVAQLFKVLYKKEGMVIFICVLTRCLLIRYLYFQSSISQPHSIRAVFRYLSRAISYLQTHQLP